MASLPCSCHCEEAATGISKDQLAVFDGICSGFDRICVQYESDTYATASS